MEGFFRNVSAIPDQILEETLATLYMTLITAIIAGIIGLIMGLILTVTEKDGILENRFIYEILDKFVNFFRAVPFIILIAVLAGVTKFLVGTTIGNVAAIVPLVFGTAPFYARQVHNALAEIDKGVIEASISMGFSPLEIIWTVYLKEGLPGIIRASTLTLISLVGLTAMMGAVGAGGLGKMAIAMGYYRDMGDVTLVATSIILVMVFIIQGIGTYLERKTTH